MQWLDLVAYGDIKLQVRNRTPDPAVMFVLDGGDAISVALEHAGFRRMRSGLWFLTFDLAECADILSRLMIDLPLARIRDMEPAEILQGYRFPVVEPPAPEYRSDAVVEGHPDTNGDEIPVSDSSLVLSDLSSQLSSEAAHGVTDSETAGVIPGEVIVDQSTMTSPEPHSVSFALVMASLEELADSGGVEPSRGAEALDEPVRDRNVPVLDEIKSAGSALSEDGGLVDLPSATAATVVADLDVEAAPVLEMECAWVVSADVSGVRDLIGLKQLADRNHLVAKLVTCETAPAVGDWNGMLAKIVPDGAIVRIVGVGRGVDGSGFGGSGDVLLVGDPGDGFGPLIEQVAVEETDAA